MVTYLLPGRLEVAKLATARVVCSAASTNVALYLMRYPDTAGNCAAAEVLRRTYTPLLTSYGLRGRHLHGSGPKVKRDRIITRLATGYANGDPGDVARRAADIIERWTRMLTEHPVPDLEEAVARVAADAGETAYDGGEVRLRRRMTSGGQH